MRIPEHGRVDRVDHWIVDRDTETLLQRATLLSRSSRAAEAMPVIERALAGAQTVGNTYQQIRLQLLRGVATRYLGDAKRAGELAREDIDAADAQHMDNLASSGLVDLGNSFYGRGDTAAAEPIFRRAWQLGGDLLLERLSENETLSPWGLTGLQPRG